MRTLCFLAISAGFSTVAFAQGNTSLRDNDHLAEQAKAMSGSGVTSDDKKFAKNAMVFGLTEVQIAKLASEKASSDAVKQFAQKVADAQEKANVQLKQLAANSKIPVPDDVDPKHATRLDKLSKLSGEEFDKAYVKDALKEREHNDRDYYMESLNGGNPGLKDFAAKNHDALQAQIDQLKSLDKGK
jgi:putative membrane protein